MNTENRNPPIPENPAYMMRTCNLDGTSKNGFVWPTEGYVECPDWNPEPKQGHGLHGLLNGEGKGRLLYRGTPKRWLIVAINPDEIVDLGGRIKVPRGWVVASYQGGLAKEIATTQMVKLCPGKAVSFSTVVVGDNQIATVGDGGLAYAGYRGFAFAGDHGKAFVGNRGCACAGNYGKAKVKGSGLARVGNHGKAIARNNSVATAGYGGKAIVKNKGMVSVGDFGIARGGEDSFVQVGNHGIAAVGERGTIQIRYRLPFGIYQTLMGFVGKNGIEENIDYRVIIDTETNRPRFVPVEDKVLKGD